MPALVSKIDEWIQLRKSWTRPGHQNVKDKHGLQKDLQDLSLLGAQCLMEPHWGGLGFWGQGPARWLSYEVKKDSPAHYCLGVFTLAKPPVTMKWPFSSPSALPESQIVHGWPWRGGPGSWCCRMHCWNSQECWGTVRVRWTRGLRRRWEGEVGAVRTAPGRRGVLLQQGSCCQRPDRSWNHTSQPESDSWASSPEATLGQ